MVTVSRVQLRMHTSESELLMVSCYKSSQCYGTGHHLSMSETHMSTEVGHHVHRQLLRSVISSEWSYLIHRVHPKVCQVV